ncbi:MAG: cell division protein ZipA [Pseudomonadota bacterium]
MDTLRLTLIVIGILILVAIYFYSKRGKNKYNDDVASYAPARESGKVDFDNVTDELEQLSGILSEARPAPRRAAPDTEAKKFQTRATPPKQQAAAPRAASPAQIVVLNVMARHGRNFSGADIRDALHAVDLQFGAMNIFHRMHRDAGAVFSLANMLEPGSFDPARMDTLSTTGLSLFMQAPAPIDTPAAYEDMLATAQRLAAQLGGDLCDERRNPLTPQTIEHTRERLREMNYKMLIERKRAAKE